MHRLFAYSVSSLQPCGYGDRDHAGYGSERSGDEVFGLNFFCGLLRYAGIFQPLFLKALLAELHDELGFHTCVETCGMTMWKMIEDIIPVLDMMYFDKII